MEHRRGNDPLPFALALEQEEDRCRGPTSPASSFLLRRPQLYSAQLRRLWRFFGREQVLVLRHEQLRLNPQHLLEKIWQHMGVPPGPPVLAWNATMVFISQRCPKPAVNFFARSSGRRSANWSS